MPIDFAACARHPLVMSTFVSLLKAASLVVSFYLICALSAWGQEKPNIVVMMSDDMGFSDIGCYGGEIATPHLDSLAVNGLRFSQFYNTGRCCPTRASLLTGLYPHQAGVGHMVQDYGLPQYQGDLNDRCVTIAEVLKSAGYRCYAAGKWHVTPNTQKRKDSPEPDRRNWPLQRGFDRFYGTIHGAGSFFDPNSLVRGNAYITPENDPEYAAKTYYYTDAISDNAARYIREHAANHPGTPFFSYVTYTAAHWPMHALPEDMAKYEGKYDGGYAPVREARIRRLKELKLLPEHWEVTPQVGNWEEVKNKEWEAACMEVYAAMVDNMDQGIGRIVATLQSEGLLENTLILFLQDNGGCAETFGRRESVGPVVRPTTPTLAPMGKNERQVEMIPPQSRDGFPLRRGPGVMPGPAETQIGYGRNWANVSNTPFREYKHWVHEGGIATPLVAHWPRGITDPNRWNDTPTHLIDIMATAISLAEADYPEGKIPLEGVSLESVFTGKTLVRSKPLFWEHEGNRAVREGDWKLVAKGVKGKWELYDMAADRTEMNDLSAKHADVAHRMAGLYEQWAAERGVVPFGSWKKNNGKKKNKKTKKDSK